MPVRTTRHRTTTRLLASVAASVVLAILAAFVMVASPASALGCAEPLDAGSIRVVIVVDAGPLGGMSSRCMVVPDGTTGAQLLARRSQELGTPAPRYESLLCAIDGRPESGCGERTAAGYAYWAYFAGASGSWIYGNGNPFIKRLRNGDVEGWRFVDGSGDGQDPPPRIGPGGLFPAVVSPPPMPPVASTSGAGSSADESSSDGSVTTLASDGSTVPTTSGPATDLDGSVDLAVAEGGDAPSSTSGADVLVLAFVGVVVVGLGLGAWVRSRRMPR